MNRPKYDGKIHKLRGFCCVYEKDGKMYVRESCSCGGCFDNTLEISENDVVVTFRRIGLNGHLRKIKVEAMSFLTGTDTILDQCELISHPEAVEYYCGGQLYDNYGTDGGKSFAAGIIKELNLKDTIGLPLKAKI